MKKNSKLLLNLMVILFLIVSCKNKTDVVHFKNKYGKHVGDSISVNGVIKKIVYDSKYYIDSIVFTYYEGKQPVIQSKYTYMKGKQVFENIDYYSDGGIKQYLFLDEQNPHYFYQREYDENGNCVNVVGELFFQGFLSNIDTALRVKNDSDLDISIFYPRPPDCVSTLYVKFGENDYQSVFYPSKYINFLSTVSATAKKHEGKIWEMIDVWLFVDDKNIDTTIKYRKPIYYKPI